MQTASFLKGFGDAMKAAEFLQGGRRGAEWSEGAKALVWDADTGAAVGHVSYLVTPNQLVSFSLDKRRVVTGALGDRDLVC